MFLVRFFYVIFFLLLDLEFSDFEEVFDYEVEEMSGGIEFLANVI